MAIRAPSLVVVIVTTLMVTACTDRSYKLTECELGSFSYHGIVEEIFRSGVHGEIQGAVFVYPSFYPEWALFFVRNKQTNLITQVHFDKSFWDAGMYPQGDKNYGKWSASRAQELVKPMILQTEFGERDVTTIRDIWSAAVSDTENETFAGLDGTTYEFYSHEGKCAATWGLSGNLRTNYLVALVETLRTYTQQPDLQKLSYVQTMIFSLSDQK
jgi:hypothetical protein